MGSASQDLMPRSSKSEINVGKVREDSPSVNTDQVVLRQLDSGDSGEVQSILRDPDERREEQAERFATIPSALERS